MARRWVVIQLCNEISPKSLGLKNPYSAIQALVGRVLLCFSVKAEGSDKAIGIS